MNVHAAHDFEHWDHAVHTVCGRFDTRPAPPGTPFFGSILHHDLGGLDIADIQVNAEAIRRQRGASTRGDDGYYFLVLQRQGSMAVSDLHQDFMLHPGDMALFDSASTFEMRPQGLINQLSVHLCRDAVERVLPPSAPRFTKINQEGLNLRLLRAMLLQIAEGSGDERTPSHGSALRDALILLLAPTLNLAEHALPGRPLRRLAESIIETSLEHPPTPTQLASRLNISVRQLYRQFEIDGDSVCRYIQRRQLAQSARELADAGQRALPITTIALKWGFNDSAHFSRAFKREYGLSPKDFRARHRP